MVNAEERGTEAREFSSLPCRGGTPCNQIADQGICNCPIRGVAGTGQMGAFQDRRFRLHVANELWRLCAGIISPEEVTEIANTVDAELNGHADGLALIHTVIARRGYTGKDVHRSLFQWSLSTG
jgi:hypothetical protein